MRNHLAICPYLSGNVLLSQDRADKADDGVAAGEDAHHNLLTRVPKCAQPWVSTLVRTIFEQPDAASVHDQHAQVVRALEAKLPQAAVHLDRARDDILAFTAFPCEVWRQPCRSLLRLRGGRRLCGSGLA